MKQGKFVRLTIVTTLGAGALALPAQGVTRYVKPGGPGTGGGTSWPTAFPNLTDALTAANSGDDIWVASGTYKPASQSSSFTLKANVEVFGGFVGTETFEHERNPNPLTNGCVLSGDLNNSNSANSGDCYHVVRANSSSPLMQESDTRLDGFTIEYGHATSTGTGGVDGGGGILLDNNPLIRNCRIRNNFAGSDGGGGVHVSADRLPIFRKCIIEDNEDSGIGGGGIHASNDTDIRVLNCIIRNNTSGGPGGGIRVHNGDSIKVISCEIRGNHAEHAGGGISVQGPDGQNVATQIVNCLFIDNVADEDNSTGGGIDFTKGLGGIINCTFDGNQAEFGGAYAQFNSASPDQTIIENCILWDNSSSEAHSGLGNVSIRESNVQGGTSAVTTSGGGTKTYDASNIDNDPLYISSSSNWHLQCGSPCINTADPNLATIPNDTEDVDENPATTGDTPDRDLAIRVQSVIPDMGCYELAPIGLCLADLDGDNCIDIDDLLEVINNWGPCPSPPPAACPGDADGPCHGIGDGQVNINDLLTVINNWGNMTCGCGTTVGGLPESYQDCAELCSEFTDPDEWAACMQACFQILCERGQTEYCDD